MLEYLVSHQVKPYLRNYADVEKYGNRPAGTPLNFILERDKKGANEVAKKLLKSLAERDYLLHSRIVSAFADYLAERGDGRNSPVKMAYSFIRTYRSLLEPVFIAGKDVLEKRSHVYKKKRAWRLIKA